jgi:hypothetical protein
MSTFVNAVCRELSCGAAATLITLALGSAFVESTAVAPGTAADPRPVPTLPVVHGWFGQPEPAVLVD